MINSKTHRDCWGRQWRWSRGCDRFCILAKAITRILIFINTVYNRYLLFPRNYFDDDVPRPVLRLFNAKLSRDWSLIDIFVVSRCFSRNVAWDIIYQFTLPATDFAIILFYTRKYRASKFSLPYSTRNKLRVTRLFLQNADVIETIGVSHVFRSKVRLNG